MKKKIFSLIMATIMVATPVSADFSDGTTYALAEETADEYPSEEQEEDTGEFLAEVPGEGAEIPATLDEFSAPDTDLSVPLEESLFLDKELVVESPDDIQRASTQDMYQISVSGTVYLSEIQKFVDLLNAEREKLGLQPVVLDQEMMEIATRRAIEGNVVYPHIFPDGTPSPYYECASIMSWHTAEKHFENWKNSPGHWAALTNPNYTRFGIVIFGNNHNYTAYTVASCEKQLIPYTNGFLDYSIKNYKIDILPEYVKPANSWLDSKSYIVSIGETMQLTPYCYGYNPEKKKLIYKYIVNSSCGIWKSTNSSVVSVDKNGLATMKKAGEAKIYFYINGDNNKYCGETTFTVNPPKVIITSISNKKSQTLTINWKKAEGVSGYVLYRKTGKNGTYKKIKTIKSGNTVSYKNTNLKKGKTYYYKIRAYGKDSKGKAVYGSWSKVVGKKCR